ncbi:MAG: hypothetical protein HC773_05665 [Scytonema sp. CRU_2_7]|nr:hypothetical protein [Scytonema sp. CRU_2_7]
MVKGKLVSPSMNFQAIASLNKEALYIEAEPQVMHSPAEPGNEEITQNPSPY